MQSSIKERLDTALHTVYEAGKLFLEGFYAEAVAVHKKAGNEAVTDYDIQIDAFIKKTLLSRFNDSWLSEESSPVTGETEYQWILDPIDGTNNFTHKIPFCCIALALQYQLKTVGAIIYDPIHEIVYYASLNEVSKIYKKKNQALKLSECSLGDTSISWGINQSRSREWDKLALTWNNLSRNVRTSRKLGSAALEITYVGAGHLGLYWIIGARIWDIAAALFFAERAGALYKVDYEREILAVYNPGLKNDLHLSQFIEKLFG